MLRDGSSDQTIAGAIRAVVNRRFSDGLETESVMDRDHEPSMASIGG
jgi:hypothetical protein